MKILTKTMKTIDIKSVTPIKKVVTKDVKAKKKVVSKGPFLDLNPNLTSRRSTDARSRNARSHYTRTITRYTKKGMKSLLLSPLFHSAFRVTAGVVVSCGLMYSSYLFIGKTFANEVVVSQSEIVARVGRLTSLPKEQPYEIVRVQDEEILRKQNSFYKDVKEGDYIIMYKNLAVIYDLRNNVVVAVKRVEEK